MLLWYSMKNGWVNAAPIAVFLMIPVALGIGLLQG